MDCEKLIDENVCPVYEVRDGMIAIKDKWYPVKLADGFYIIRKLTVQTADVIKALTRERDMAIEALRGECGVCKNDTGWSHSEPCESCKYWEWGSEENAKSDNWEWCMIQSEDKEDKG